MRRRAACLLAVGVALLAAGCASGNAVQPGPPDTLSVEAGTLQPLLRWPAIPHPGAGATVSPGQPGNPWQVTYDLRIWRAEDGHPIALEYEREGLPEPSHRIEQPLTPSADYVWSVRARFLLDSHVRVSDWSVLLAPRLPVVPHPFLPRFRTPPA